MNHEWYHRPTSQTDRTCTECAARFTAPSPSSKTCSPKCSHARHERIQKARYVKIQSALKNQRKIQVEL